MTSMVEQINVPEYLNKEFFRQALENGLNVRNVNVKEIDMAMGSSGGDNYCSAIYRAKVQYSCDGDLVDQTISLIVKSMDKDIEKNLPVPTKEIAMYSEVIPEMEKLLAYDGVVFAPKCYYIINKPVCTFVFEDLSTSGLILQDRVNGLDEIHAKVILKKIGQLHAASIYLAEKNPDRFNKFDESAFHAKVDDSPILKEICIENGYYLADLVETWEGFENVAKKIRSFVGDFTENVKKCLDLDKPGRVRVLNHGDLWVNNFLFKYDNNSPVDVSLIDLQLSYYGSPGVDLNYFMNTSLQLEVFKTKRTELLMSYYESLRSTLDALGAANIPSWEDIKEEFRSTARYGYAALQAVFPLVALDKADAKDSSFELYNDKNAALLKRRIMFATPRVLEEVKYLLPRFEELKIFD